MYSLKSPTPTPDFLVPEPCNVLLKNSRAFLSGLASFETRRYILEINKDMKYLVTKKVLIKANETMCILYFNVNS